MEVIANCEIVVIGERILGGKSNMAFHVQIQRKTMKSQSPSEKTIWYRIFVSIYDLCIYQQSLTHSSFRTWNWSCMWAFPLFLIILFFLFLHLISVTEHDEESLSPKKNVTFDPGM